MTSHSNIILVILLPLLLAPAHLWAVKSTIRDNKPKIKLTIRYKNEAHKNTLIELAYKKYIAQRGYLPVMRSGLNDIKKAIKNDDQEQIYRGLAAYTWAYKNLGIRSWKSKRDKILKLNTELKTLMRSKKAKDYFATADEEVDPMPEAYHVEHILLIPYKDSNESDDSSQQEDEDYE
jgi:hypothetical protein